MTRTPGLHDPNVSDAEYADRVDVDRDHYPTRAEAQEVDEYPAPKRVDTTGDPLLERLQEHVRLNKYAEAREAAENARRDGDHAGARWWDAEAERWAG